ncbi:uncharacterized protein METZ01_LOCUS181685, partial [marine metagenome]
ELPAKYPSLFNSKFVALVAARAAMRHINSVQ